MRAPREVMGSAYMHWAKTRSNARFNLATSGIANMKLNELDVKLEDLEITGDSGYGYPPLQQALAARVNVAPESIVTAAGTTFANHLAMAAILRPGDQVLIEHPTYEPLLALARYLGAEIKRFPRLFTEEFQVSGEHVERNLSSRTRLIVLTNLNNPSGALTNETTVRKIGELAKSIKAHILVDEVYLETLFDKRPQTAFHYGSEFLVTSSLTKAFGLSGLRCGWIVAEPELAQRMWLLNDLFAATPVHAGERLSLIALEQLDDIARRADALLKTNRALANQFFESREDLQTTRPKGGTVFFPRLKHGSADSLCRLLRDEFETSVVPGSFFEMPEHFRIGIGCHSETLASGLKRIGQALDKLRRT